MKLLNQTSVKEKQLSFLYAFEIELLKLNFYFYNDAKDGKKFYFNKEKIFDHFRNFYPFYTRFQDITEQIYGTPKPYDETALLEFQIAKILTFYVLIKFIFQIFQWPVVDDEIASKEYLKNLKNKLEYCLNGSYYIMWDNDKQIGNFKNPITFPSFFKAGTEKLMEKIDEGIRNKEVKSWLELLVQPLNNGDSIIASIAKIHSKLEAIDKDKKILNNFNDNDRKIWNLCWSSFKCIVNKVDKLKAHHSKSKLSIWDVNATTCTLGYVLYKLYETYKNKEENQ